MSIEWTEQKVSAGMAPWIAEWGKLTLFVQPWYGDGVKYRGIIQHPDWTLTLKERFLDKETAMKYVESVSRNIGDVIVQK
jgi:hypothetical protein